MRLCRVGDNALAELRVTQDHSVASVGREPYMDHLIDLFTIHHKAGRRTIGAGDDEAALIIVEQGATSFSCRLSPLLLPAATPR